MLQQVESKTPSIHVLLADTHQIVRNGIRQELQTQTDMMVMGDTADGYDLLDLVRSTEPDVVILDIKLARLNGVKVTQCLSRMTHEMGSSPPSVLVYSGQDDKQYIWSLMAAGAKGYLLKSEPLDQLLIGIRQIAAGYTFLSRRVQTSMVEVIPDLNQELSDAETKVIQLLAHGFSNKEIAQNLQISEGTVRCHLNNTYRKVPWIRTRAEAIAWAWINRIVPDID